MSGNLKSQHAGHRISDEELASYLEHILKDEGIRPERNDLDLDSLEVLSAAGRALQDRPSMPGWDSSDDESPEIDNDDYFAMTGFLGDENDDDQTDE